MMLGLSSAKWSKVQNISKLWGGYTMRNMRKLMSILFTLVILISMISCDRTDAPSSDVASKDGSNATSLDNSVAESSDSENSSDEESGSSEVASNMDSVVSEISSNASNSSVSKEPTVTGTPSALDAIKSYNLNGKVIKIITNAYTPGKMMETESGKNLMKRLADIEKKFNCKIDIQPIDWGSFQAKFYSGQLQVDIIGSAAWSISDYYKNNTVAALDDLDVDFDSPAYDQGAVKSMFINGKHYGLKKVNEGFEKIQYAHAMFMNKTLIKKYAGIDPDSLYDMVKNGTWTWEVFEDICKKVTRDLNSDGIMDIWGTENSDSDSFLWLELMQSNNGPFVKDVNGVNSMNMSDAKSIEALRFWKKMIDAKILNPNDYTNPITAAGFTSGKVAFFANYLDRLNNQQGIGYGAMKDEIGVLPIPKGPKASRYYADMSYFEGYAIANVALKSDDANNTYAKQLSAILQSLCQPYYTVDQELKNRTLEFEAIARDQGTADMLQLISGITVGTKSYTSPRFLFNNEVLIPLVAPGTKSIEAAVGENLTKYNTILKDMWSLN
jgi:ABC-type glycerol-3-phosphate transport system substrate-binding protein